MRDGFDTALSCDAIEALIDPSTASGTTIGTLIDRFTPEECANYFAAAGYDRVIDAGLSGTPARHAAVRFGVGIAAATRWINPNPL